MNQTIQTQEKQLAAGKKMLEFIEAYKNTKGKKTNDELTLQVMQFLKAQKTKNDVKKKTSKPSRQLSKKQIANYQQERIAIGSKVKIIATRQIAIVEAMKGKNTTLSIGNTRIKVALDKLIWVS